MHFIQFNTFQIEFQEKIYLFFHLFLYLTNFNMFLLSCTRLKLLRIFLVKLMDF